VRRRYREFLALSKTLYSVTGSSHAVSAMPPKKRCWVGAPSKVFLERRRQNLEIFVRRLMECDGACRCDAVRLFFGLGPMESTRRKARLDTPEAYIL
jgi:hypothetical protein